MEILILVSPVMLLQIVMLSADVSQAVTTKIRDALVPETMYGIGQRGASVM